MQGAYYGRTYNFDVNILQNYSYHSSYHDIKIKSKWHFSFKMQKSPQKIYLDYCLFGTTDELLRFI